jgi:hypothetical protein
MSFDLVLGDAPYITSLKSGSMAADVPITEFDQASGAGDVPYIACRKAAQPMGDVPYITPQFGCRTPTLSHQKEVR